MEATGPGQRLTKSQDAASDVSEAGSRSGPEQAAAGKISRGDLKMKKQFDMHTPSRIRENETVATNLPQPAFSESRPKGVQDHLHPGHISRGAAESQTDPVKDKPQVEHAKNRR